MADQEATDPKPGRVLPELAPADYCDPVIEYYKKDVDRTLLRENLKLSVDERVRKFEQFMQYAMELQEAGRKARAGQ